MKGGGGLMMKKNEVGAENCFNLHNECYCHVKGLFSQQLVYLLSTCVTVIQGGQNSPIRIVLR